MTKQREFKINDRIRMGFSESCYHPVAGTRGIVVGVMAPDEESGETLIIVDWLGANDRDGMSTPSKLMYGHEITQFAADNTPPTPSRTYVTGPGSIIMRDEPCSCPPAWHVWNPCSRFGWLTYMVAGAFVPYVLEQLGRVFR